MKTDTKKLYSKMKPKELALLYCRAPDDNERDKIASSVPKHNYYAIDTEFSNELDALCSLSLWWQAEFWRVKASLMSEIHDMAITNHNTQQANLYVSALVGLEQALPAVGLEHVLEQNDMGLNAQGLVEVYELNLVSDFVEKSKTDAIATMELALGRL